MSDPKGFWHATLRTERALVRVERLLIGFCLFGILVCTALGIYFRLSRISVPWTNEVAQILLVWMMFLAAALGIYYNEHVGMSALVERLPERLRKTTIFVAHICVLLFCIYVTVTGVWYVYFAERMGGGTISLPIVVPSWVIALVLPLSFGFGIVHAVLAFLNHERGVVSTGEPTSEHTFN